MAAMGFQFQEKSNPLGFVYQMAPRLDEYPPEDLLVAPYLMEEFDGELIQEYLGYVTPDNMLVEITAPDIEGESVEPWFKVPYTLQRTDLPRTTTKTDNLGLPSRNPFLPENLELQAGDQQGIVQSVNMPGIQLWQDTEVSYGAPRANLFLELAVSGGLESPADRAMSQVYRMLVEDHLSELVYPAYLAGLGYSE